MHAVITMTPYPMATSSEVFFLKADGSDTQVRLRSGRRLRDGRQLPEVLALFEPHGFLRRRSSGAVPITRDRLLQSPRCRRGPSGRRLR
jgi:hypothetical protein